jgi:PAS domain S-box-containing protein
VQKTTLEAGASAEGTEAQHSWRKRHGEALRLSNVVLFGQDEDLRFLWIENHPQGLTADEVKGRSDDEIMPLAAAQQILPAKREVLNTGTPRVVEFQWQIGETLKWYELRIEAVRNSQGRITGVNCAALDISERKQSESHLRVLMLELAHRSKNLLAVIQGISNQTAQGSTSIEEFSRRFSGRLLSLSRAHDILSDQNWRGAGMRELIRTQVLLFAGAAGDRIDYEGDAMYLRPNAAQHIGLALYELTANALKYGALSSSAGKVKIRWAYRASRDNTPAQFTLAWLEEGGPMVQAPDQRHFGRMLLEEVVPLSVQGTASLEFEPGGVHYRISMPASELS